MLWAAGPGSCASDIGRTYRGWRIAGSPHLVASAMRPDSAPNEGEVSMRTTNAIAQLGLASLTLLASACGGEPDVASTETLQPTGDEVEARATLTEGRNAHGSPPVPCGQVDEFPLPSTTGSLFP